MSEKLVIFDCDGTLVDSQHLIVAAMTSAFEGVGHPVPARAEILSIVGLSLPFAIETLMPGAPRDQVLAVSDGYKSAFGVL
ncbi:MAG: HAD hydrolase-like protein, partial [Pseudomonadota bacterium]